MEFVRNNINLENTIDNALISEELCTKLFNSIVNISQNHDSKNRTGFLIKIKINNQTFKYLITCIDEDIKEKKVINLFNLILFIIFNF